LPINTLGNLCSGRLPRQCELVDRTSEAGGLSLVEVWESHSAECDRETLFMAGKLADFTDEAIDELIDETFKRALEMIERPEIWQAVLAVADSRRQMSIGAKFA
jgi:hypothetical protein